MRALVRKPQVLCYIQRDSRSGECTIQKISCTHGNRHRKAERTIQHNIIYKCDIRSIHHITKNTFQFTNKNVTPEHDKFFSNQPIDAWNIWLLDYTAIINCKRNQINFEATKLVIALHAHSKKL